MLCHLLPSVASGRQIQVPGVSASIPAVHRQQQQQQLASLLGLTSAPGSAARRSACDVAWAGDLLLHPLAKQSLELPQTGPAMTAGAFQGCSADRLVAALK